MVRPLFAVALGLLSAGNGRAENQTVHPKEDTEIVLHNPDMGWVLYENYPIDARPQGTATMSSLPGATFEGCDFVAVMFAWSDVEKEANSFDWSRVDAAWDYWAQRGKTLHLRMSTEPLFGWAKLNPPGGLGIPEWLLAQIPDSQKKRREDGAQSGWHVDARNILYQERLRIFLEAAARHFSGARTPALVDLRGFGRWGEWHSGFPYPSVEEKRAALETVLEIWSKAFSERMLALSYSYDPDGPAALHAGSKHQFDPAFTQNYEEYLHYSAFDLALQKPNLTLRRDGAGGAVSSNERKLSDTLYRQLRRAPQMSEFVGGYGQVRGAGPAYLKWTIDDALSLHPNYISLLGYSGRDGLDFLLERPDLIAHGLRGMGYRLVPLSITLPKALKAGEPVILEMEWINRAAGRALRDYSLEVRLVGDQAGRPWAEATAGSLPTSQWLQGDRQTSRLEVVFPKIAGPGPATLQISLRDPASKQTVRLPLSSLGRDGFYNVGPVSVLP